MMAPAEPLADSSSRLSTRVVLLSIAGIWSGYFLLATLRGFAVGFDFTPAILARRAAVTLGAMAITVVLWGLLRVLERRPLWVRAIVLPVAALPAAIAIASLNQAAFADIESELSRKIGERDGLRIRSDEAGNILVDVPEIERIAEQAARAAAEAVTTADGAGKAPDGNATDTGTAPAPDRVKVAVALKNAHTPSPVVSIDEDSKSENRLQQIADLALGRYFVLIAWVALFLALGNAAQARVAERREGEYRRAAKAAELRSLRYQVNPHFLFNTLNSLSALVMTGKADAAERMIQTLARFYRASLSEDPTADHTLGEEIALQQHYLEIEAVRFPERLRVAIDVSDELAMAMVPGMILQPLIENSVKYAVAATSRPVTITIAARLVEGGLEVSVGDDGPGANEAKPGFGIGLTNVLDRLRARFGDNAALFTRDLPEGHASIIRIPFERDHD